MSNDMIPLLTKALGETVYMVAVSMAIASALGIPLGVLLYATDKGQILESPMLNKVIGTVVNAIRSIPFIILMVAIIPLTRLLVGSAIGTTAAMVPLVIRWKPASKKFLTDLLKRHCRWGQPPCRLSAVYCCRNPCPALWRS